MFIIFGTKVVRRRLGRMADHCLLCRDVHPFRVTEIATVGHLYYIPLGARKVHGQTKSCERCGTTLDVQDGDLESLSGGRRDELEDLIALADPEVRRRWDERRALENAAKTKGLGSPQRLRLILEPLMVANNLLVARTGRMQLDGASGLGCLATVAIPALMATLALNVGFSGGPNFALTIAIVVGILAAITLGLVATDGRRFAKRKLLPLLVRALRPLDPTAEELGLAFELLKKDRHKIAKVLDAERLREAIRADGDVADWAR